ncbi:MAG TPA: dihydroorotase [Flavobacteriaceae bacterium]|nr:dihydroorotase [Flavobacteriaceae bacterium]
MKVLIKSTKIIDSRSSFHQKTRDILIDNSKIAEIASAINQKVDREINIENLHVSRGWFDSSICFGEPGYEERETLENGLRVAAQSGFTGLALNPDTLPVIDNQSAVKFLINKTTTAATRLQPIGALTQGSKGEDLAEMFDMKQAGAVAFGDYKKPIKDPNLLKIALQYSRSFDALIQAYPNENALTKNAMVNEGEVSTQLGLKGMPAMAEELQVNRDLEILKYTGGKLHIPTISTAGSVELIARAKEKGLDVTCSVAISNLFFTDEKLQEFDADFKVLPPLRTEEDRKALIAGVESGVIDMVTTDHRPVNIELKKLEFEHAEFGSIGLESAFGALNKLFGVEKAVELLTAGRARFGLESFALKKGNKAELSFFIPDLEYEFSEKDIFSQSKNSMFLKAKLKGKALGVFANNQIIVKVND